MARLERAAVRLAGEQGLEYVDTELTKEPSGRFLRIYIDSESGITLDELEAYHRAILKSAEDIDYDYMEVSSPGADRPLKKPRDFEKALGCEVEVKLYKPVNGSKTHIGTLDSYDGEKVTLTINGIQVEFTLKETALIRPYIDVDSELEQSTDN
ncbi:MAG: ribosome maturation factor RimP [Clostridia bacterium]|nr:ribosome maturation factor RimP [Clostridia bacterium]